MRPILRFLRMFLFWAALAPAGISAQDLPEPMSPRRLVNDFAGLLSDSQRQALERKLVDFDRETSTQIAVVTVDDLGDYAPSDFAQRLHDKWGVGREGKNNGILVLVKPSVPGSRGEAYISVGYGLDAQYGTESYVGLTTDKPEQSYMIKPTISWEVDLFGKIRRMSEADRAQMLATDRAAQGVMVSLAAEVATTYFDYLQYEYAEYISRSTLRSREDTYRLMESSYRAGTINEMELSQSRAAVATAQAAIPRFERARQQALHALSLLLGQNPSDDLIGRHASLAELDMPEEIPAGLPSDLLERRPDMQEAYYQVMAANAEIGVAQAMRFPSIALTANGGTLSDDVSRLFGSKSYLWSVAGNLTGPVFQFGANKRRVQIAREKHRESVLNYEQCYLQALREVEDALTAVNTYRAQIEAMKTLVRSAERADTVAMQRYRGGLTDYLDVLDAERTLFEAQTDYADAVGSAMSSYVTLYKALGGGITMPATEAN